jgi:hypothetical protein
VIHDLVQIVSVPLLTSAGIRSAIVTCPERSIFGPELSVFCGPRMARFDQWKHWNNPLFGGLAQSTG